MSEVSLLTGRVRRWMAQDAHRIITGTRRGAVPVESDLLLMRHRYS